MTPALLAIFTKDYPTEDKIEELMHPYDENLEVPEYVDADGETTTYNPKSKWDWYNVCRWNPETFEIDGVRYYSEPPYTKIAIKVENLIDKTNKIKNGDYWDDKLFNSYIKLVKEGDILEADYYRKRYPSFIDYMLEYEYKDRVYSSVLTPDGEWHEPGSLGWWGIDNTPIEDRLKFGDTFCNNFLVPNKDCYISVVNYHI